MRRNYVVTGVANVDIFKGSTLIATATTFSNTGINFSASNEEIRGGMGNALYAKYYYNSTMEITLEDIMFKLEWLALNTGSSITQGSDILEVEQVTLGANGTGTVTGTPIAWQDSGTIGWAAPAGTTDWVQITFAGKDFSVPNAATGAIYCIKYQTSSSAARKITISSTFVPDTVHLVMRGYLYAAGDSTSISASASAAASNQTIAGVFQVDVPRFQFSGNQEISMTSNGYATTPMSGNALANMAVDCGSSGWYATITELIYNTHWYDNAIDLAVAGGDIELAVGDNVTLSVRAIPSFGSAFQVPNADLTFTTKNDAVATVDAEGVVTPVAEGETAIIVTVTDKPELEGIAYVTVGAGL